MDKQQQLNAIVSVLQAVNSLPVTGAQAEIITGIKQVLNQVGAAIQAEVQAANPSLTDTGNTSATAGESEEEAPEEAAE